MSTASYPANATTDDVGTSGGPARAIARLFGIVFLLVGVLGFIPKITTHYSSMSFAGHMSGAMLLGLFQCRYSTTSCTCCTGWSGWFCPARTAPPGPT